MKNFRFDLQKNSKDLKKSISNIKNSVVKDAILKMTTDNVGGHVAPSWLKAHGDATWMKS
ncbi:hypothetical protein GNY06_09515 [Elizabethkingia argentiflava]|uniref:Uncharacterized protein n=1 Tax=Elizabethkingia argenteiflava TaxID=2681556 RepID=A0A845PZ18_9FLAO|nr:hypothetical protein [Elizabethkingia argenteiflava]NAW51608.1 hypothetical protein [Elizabethkingia argenteiflava]